MKKCTKCGIEKPLSEFHKDKKTKLGVRSSCKNCYSKFHSNYYLNNKETVQAKNKKHWLKRKYNLETEDYQAIKNKQNGKCAICANLLEDTNLVHVDHDHKTGKIRGILCRWCNTGLGNFRDSIENLESAQKYLQKYNKKADKNSSVFALICIRLYRL